MQSDQKAIQKIAQETADLYKELHDLGFPLKQKDQERCDAIMARLSELTDAYARALGLSDTEITEINEQTERKIEARVLAETDAVLDALRNSGIPDVQAIGDEVSKTISAKLKRGVKGSA